VSADGTWLADRAGPDERHHGRVRIEASHKRVRVVFGGRVIVDTDDALYVWEGPWYPRYYLSLTDVAKGVLHPSPTVTRSPSRGTATHYRVRAGGREAVDAAWSYHDSPLEALRGRVRFEWDAMDAWFEEDEEIFVHPRNPSTRFQILPSSRRVVVEVDGVIVAESRRPVLLYETNLPRRTYLPKLDVRMDLLMPTATSSMCPYKGTARYWTLRTPSGEQTDIAWSYPAPFRESAPIAGLVAFYDERVDVSIDGMVQAKPRTGRSTAGCRGSCCLSSRSGR
jgi:uncharacterized protein (DUF427 family)